ncbi:MAG: aminopeptidase [Solirubrobacterales bacterium]
MSDLDRAVRAVVRDCLVVREGEDVLVIANPATQPIGERLRDESEDAGGDSVLAVMRERAQHGTEPPDPIAAAMLRADVIMAPTVQSLSHTAARRAATDAGARAATLPGVTEEMLARVMSADMGEIRRRGHAVADILTAGSEARITCPNGSDLVLSLEGRTATPDTGELSEPGAFGNLPCGEGFISPLHDTGSGRLVVDGTIGSIGIPKPPAEIVIEDGQLVSAAGADGQELMDQLTRHGPDASRVAELGVGTNEKAILSGELLEDEKILGTVHVAFGASAGIGGTIQVPVHLDCVVMKPHLAIDGEPLVRAGELLV